MDITRSTRSVSTLLPLEKLVLSGIPALRVSLSFLITVIHRTSTCTLSTWHPSTQGRTMPLLCSDSPITSWTFQTGYLAKITKFSGVVAEEGLKSRANVRCKFRWWHRMILVQALYPRELRTRQLIYQMLKNGRAGEPVRAADLKHCSGVLFQAARATYYCMTNQILHAKMSGRRPILVSMGTNALSVN
jgi:hypothetical protein